MAKKPKKPKLTKKPTAPSQKSSLETWERYKKRCEEIRKNNQKKLSDWDKKCKAIDAAEKKKKQIREKTKSLGNI